jgi:penicillin-binding protein 1A
MMRRRIRETESSGGSFFQTLLSRPLLALLIVVLCAFTAVVGYTFYLSRDLPSLSQLEDYEPKLSSKVYSSDMQVIHEYYEEKRSFVRLEDMPGDLINAVIATEDRFSQGASTLTQQLARQLYLSLDKRIARKVKELITAIQIERTYTKEEILEMYFNHMNFGGGTYGAQNAAQKYYGKDVHELSLDECATLVGVLQRPEALRPDRQPDRALRRRNIVLNAMHAMNYISADELSEFIDKPLDVLKEQPSKTDGLAPYFTEYVRQLLQDRYGYNLYTDGLSIYTTLDARAQACAESAVRRFLPELQQVVKDYHVKKGMLKDLVSSDFIASHDWQSLEQDSAFVDSLTNTVIPVQCGLVSLDPRNGHILAWIGGRDFTESKYNRVIQARRQPGSAFKPFIYTVAIDNGYKTTDEELDQPVVVYNPDGTRWTPQNYDLTTGGPTTLREALRRSRNLVSVRVMQNRIRNPKIVVDYAHKMGIKSNLDAVDALALGACDVTPLEITSAYSVFPNGGIRVEPVAILRVEDRNGNIIDQYQPSSQEVLRRETAFIITDLLQTVLKKGTGATAGWKYGFTRPGGGKTGTTNEFSDAWFIGFTPSIVSTVWTGLDDYTISLGKGQSGARAALPIWATFMKAVHDTLDLPVLDFEMPTGVVRVEVCSDSKELANEVCPNIIDEVFFRSNAPTQQCSRHVGLTTNGSRDRRSNEKRVRF